MKEVLFTGSGVAIVTPFKDGTVNMPVFGRLIDRQLAEGTDAIIVCGTTGEAATMTTAERQEAIGFCVDRVAGRVPVIAGTGANDTRVACGNALAAERLGADGLLIVTPYYNKATQQGLLRHYKAIADSVTTPIILITFPPAPGSIFCRKPMRSWPGIPTSSASRKPAEISARYRRPETSALLILLSGPAMMTRRPPSVCWAAPGSFLWQPMSSLPRCTN